MTNAQGGAWAEGTPVRHRMSGWAGYIVRSTPCDQRTLVTVRPVRPRPLEVWDENADEFRPTPEDWPGWRPMTVYADELTTWPSPGAA